MRLPRLRWPRRVLVPAPVGTAAHLDPGLQPERTTLAWSRTALACVIVSAVFLRWLPFYGLPLLWLPMLTALAALGIASTQHRRTRRGVRAIRDESTRIDPWPMLALLALTQALGVAGVVFVVVS